MSIHEHTYREAKAGLAPFGKVARSDFHNVLTLAVPDVALFLENLRAALEIDPRLRAALGRVVPATQTFDFQTPEEFERRATEAVRPFAPLLAGQRFHVRMHRRGFRGKLSSQHEEQFLDVFLLGRLAETGTPGQIGFDDPDAVVTVETVGQRAGVALWTRAELERYPFLHTD